MVPTRIIVHHSSTKDSGTVSWDAIRRYHIVENGWDDIGYHMGLELVGNHYELLMGRMWDITGAHCGGHNERSLGLCVVGNWEDEPVPAEQWEMALSMVRFWMRLYRIPRSQVFGHREFKATDCPGKYFDLDKFRGEL